MSEDKEQSLITHLEALRETLIRCFVAVGIILPFAFFISPKVLNFLIKVLVSDNNITLNYFAPMEVFILQIKLALLISFVLSFPYILKKVWNFVLPALYENERNFIRASVFISGTLFCFGVIFCLFCILPLIINFGISFSGNNVKALFGVSNVVNLALGLSLTFGLMFQVPLVVFMMIKWGILSYEAVSSKRPYVVVILLISAALLTPPDIVSQILLFVPTYMLFELGLVFSKICNKNQA
ncbi:twin-arginine translocase subunit TatC [bacterium]|nr:twin-arginine translocase subunit TatC [bacterium]